jgi:hypothetical protein
LFCVTVRSILDVNGDLGALVPEIQTLESPGDRKVCGSAKQTKSHGDVEDLPEEVLHEQAQEVA